MGEEISGGERGLQGLLDGSGGHGCGLLAVCHDVAPDPSKVGRQVQRNVMAVPSPSPSSDSSTESTPVVPSGAAAAIAASAGRSTSAGIPSGGVSSTPAAD